MRNEKPNVFEDVAKTTHNSRDLISAINECPDDQLESLIIALRDADTNRFTYITNVNEMRELRAVCSAASLPALLRALPPAQQQLLAPILCTERSYEPLIQARMPVATLLSTPASFQAVLGSLLAIERDEAAKEDRRQTGRRPWYGDDRREPFWDYFWQGLKQPSAVEALKNLNLSAGELARLLCLAFNFGRNTSIHYALVTPSERINTIINILPKELLPLIYTILTNQGANGVGQSELYFKLTHQLIHALCENKRLIDLVGNDPAKLATLMCRMQESETLIAAINSKLLTNPELQQLAIQTVKLLPKNLQEPLFLEMARKGWGYFIHTPADLDCALKLAPTARHANNIISTLMNSEKCFRLIEAMRGQAKLKNLSDEKYSLLFVAGHQYSPHAKQKITEYGERLLAELPSAEKEIFDAFNNHPESIRNLLFHLSPTTCITLLRIMKNKGDASLVEHLQNYFKCFSPPKLSSNQQNEINNFKQRYLADRERLGNSPLRHNVAKVFGAAAGQSGLSNFVADLDKLDLRDQFSAIIHRLMSKDHGRSTHVINDIIEQQRRPQAAGAGAAPAESSHSPRLFTPSAPPEDRDTPQQAPSAPPQEDPAPAAGPPGGPTF